MLSVMATSEASPFGRELRHWRQVRGTSQLELALEAKTTSRHISFLETGRSRPSQRMIERLGHALSVPLRERNLMMEAAGLRPEIAETAIEAPGLEPFRQALRRLLDQHSPYPAMVLDRHFDVVDTNGAAAAMLGEGHPLNVVELLYAGAWRELIDNWEPVAWYGLRLLRDQQIRYPSDERLAALVQLASEALEPLDSRPELDDEPVQCPHFRFGDQLIKTIAVTAHFGGSRDVTLEELRVELIYPRDDVAERFFRAGPPAG